jgi:hypothetical protein
MGSGASWTSLGWGIRMVVVGGLSSREGGGVSGEGVKSITA